MLQLRLGFEAIQASTWITVAVTLLGLMLTHLVMHWLVSRKARREEAAPLSGEPTAATGQSPELRLAVRRRVWRGAVLTIPPIALLLWVQGLHFAVTAVLADLQEHGPVAHAVAAIDWLQGIGTLLALVWLLARIGVALDEGMRWFAKRSPNGWGEVLAGFAGRAARLLLPLMAIILGAPALTFSPPIEVIVRNAVSMMVIGTIAFLLLQLVDVFATIVLQRQQLTVSDNRRARAIYTQVVMLRKIVTAVIALVAVASMLMVFESVRHFGTALIASAGVAGIIVGFAAQKSIATLLAGFQIAITQPIRIDDVVIVEGEWGQIEEITLTYVVVRIWDLRRLILPIGYFIEKPFQNWTRTSAEIIGSVFLYVDYRVPLAELRAEFMRLIETNARWDKKVAVLQVTDTKQHTVELRVLVSSRDASTSWDLRCDVREQLIEYLQKHHPDSLPRLRMAAVEGDFASRLPAAPGDPR